MVSTPELQGYGARRRSPRWLAMLLPVSLLLALVRLLARAAARAVLVLPKTIFDVDRFFKTLGWTAGGWLVLRAALFHHAVFFERDDALFWLWREAELLFVFPRWLNGLWNPWFGAYQPDRFFSVVKPWLLLLGVWTLGLHLVVAIVRAIRIGFGPDGETLPPWPRPRLRAPLPFGFLINGFAFALWLAPAFALLTTLPPRTRPYWPWAPLNDPLKLAIPIWNALQWLILPRRLDSRVQALIQRDPAWTSRGAFASSPQHHVSSVTLELLGIEIGLISIVLAAVWTALWLLSAWSHAADGSNDGVPWSGGPRRRSPGWAKLFLPITFPAAVVARSAWRIPLWLPKLLVKAAALYLVGVLGLGLTVWIDVGRHYSSNWATMQFLRHWWDLLEGDLRYPALWHDAFHAIPHGRKQRISDGDVVHAMALLTLVDAAALVPLVVLLRLAFVLLKRSLEAIAR